MKSEFDLEKSRLEVKRKLAELEGAGEPSKVNEKKFDMVDNIVIAVSVVSMIAYFIVLEFGQFNGL